MEIEVGSVVGNENGDEGINDDVMGAYLVWEEVTVVIPNMGNGPTTRLLNGLTGFAQPGRIMAIMGPSGSGKSTLLHSLAGRLPRNVVMKGNVVFNGGKRRVDYGTLAYVTQEDVLLGTLTVKETIKYSAELRVSPREEVNGLVERTIIEMGLEDCADRFVGNWHLRGISGGEKKRLSIALEILTRPTLLLLDEPTTGLDSASAFFVVQALRNVSADGTTIISSIHQPSSEVFALFDDLFLLSGGETVYFGEAKMALQFFAESGYSCPSRRNPSDHFLRCINSDFDQVNATLHGSHRLRDSHKSTEDVVEMKSATEIKAILVDKYRRSKFALRAKERIREISSIEGFVMGRKRESGTTWWKQLWALTRRSSVNMSRDIGYYWLRIVVYTIVSICVGTVFFDIGTSYNAVMARGACGGFVSGFMTIMSIGGFPSFIEEMKVFSKERLNGHYGVGVFIISNFLSSFPFLALMSFSTATITYYMVKFQPGLLHVLYANIDLLGSIAVVESCMMVVASLVPNFLMGIIVGAGFIGIMMMTAGFFRLIPDLPKLFWTYPMSYINYMAWALQGAYKNDMIGLEFDSNDGFKVKGEVLLQNILGISVKHSKWWDLLVVFAILIFYRLLFFTILKLKETALPAFHKIYVKRTLKQINKRASFRKALPTPFPSKRHHHPLSSQEGLFFSSS